MDFSVAFGDLNWWAVLVSVGSVMVIGSLWYANFLFGKAWVAAVGKTRIELQQGRTILWLMLTTFLWTLILVTTIAILEQLTGAKGWQDGLTIGLLIGVGIGVAAGTIHGLFENRFNSLIWITAGYTALLCIVPAVILAVWR